MGLYCRFRDAWRIPLQDGAVWLGQGLGRSQWRGFGGMVASKDPLASAAKTDLPCQTQNFTGIPQSLEQRPLALLPHGSFTLSRALALLCG